MDRGESLENRVWSRNAPTIYSRWVRVRLSRPSDRNRMIEKIIGRESK